MQFNNVIDTLRGCCQELSAQYAREYQIRCEKNGSSLWFYRYLVTDEIAYKLCMLTDREYPGFDAFRTVVKGLLPVHLNPSLQNPCPEAEGHIRAAEQAFLAHLAAVGPDCTRPGIPYLRNLTGEEAEIIAARFREKWNYVPQKYWYPMNGQENREDRLFLSVDYVEYYWDRLEKLLGLPEKHLFCLSENIYPGGPACMEMAELTGYGGLENACCDRDFAWIIYFSHENTVTFAGSILPQIRKLLASEREHWNAWE